MTKRNYLIKILIYLLAAVFCFGMFGCFVGCQSDENGRENSLQFIYLQVSDNQGNTFYLGKDNTTHEKDLEYEYKLGDLKFTAEAYYENGEKCTQQTFISFKQNTIHLDEPGGVSDTADLSRSGRRFGRDLQIEHNGERTAGYAPRADHRDPSG